MLKLTPDDIEKLKESLGGIEIHHLVNDEHQEEIVVKVPSWPIYRTYQETRANADTRAVAMKKLVTDVLVYPTPAVFEGMVAGRPALVDVFGADVLEVAGGTKTTRKKY